MNASRRAWLMWALGLSAYCIAVFHRASLGVAGPLAQQRFGATAAVLSLFLVLQLAVYAGLQVPVGVLLDRVGSRRMIVGRRSPWGSGRWCSPRRTSWRWPSSGACSSARATR